MVYGEGYTPYGQPGPTAEDWKAAFELVSQEVAELRKKHEDFDKHFDHKLVSASNQLEYFSNQLIKWDMEAIAVTPTGITVAGAEVYRFPWVTSLENTRLGVVGRARRAADAAHADEDEGTGGAGATGRLADLESSLRTQTDRINNLVRARTLIRRTLTTHGQRIRQLAAGQAATARLSERSIARQAGHADRRAQRPLALPPQRRSAQAEAAELRQIQNALRDVRTQAQALSHALA
ncbi:MULTISPECIES: hypothetical protein [Streptomyces]|uniref:hypothetical protein n=1 Tax=Streptomyces TaxID=1883 RepID=UPI0016440A0D|nr:MULTISPECIES: hypothetical protein [Streptomyces]MBT3079287.1 hypothetical protein [Streptomyces sp. COG20]MBT3086139.1 hypothetical protein [Streptomyces sp. CYG21]MBT3095070.1 hypothetical protein [Streptomyces sp. CBG30]MDI7788152.1 hypothetical protein [Streptomyces cavourensis]